MSITIRLPGIQHPVRVHMAGWQRVAVVSAAGTASVSAWARAMLDAASGDRTYADAAAAADLDVTTWIRVVILECAGATDLRRQLGRACRASISTPRAADCPTRAG